VFPGAREIGQFGLRDARRIEIIMAEDDLQRFAVQHREPRPRPLTAPDRLHRRLIEPSPRVGDRGGVKSAEAVAAKKRREFARHAAAPVHHGAEHVKAEELYVQHGIGSIRGD
jgi:hypothetical protein